MRIDSDLDSVDAADLGIDHVGAGEPETKNLWEDDGLTATPKVTSMFSANGRPMPENRVDDWDRMSADADQFGGDPVADYVSLWLELDGLHQSKRLTEEGWAFLGDRLQRPIEMRLLERRPVTLAGAAAALDLATYIMEHLDGVDSAGDAAWYRRLRLHLVHSAREFIHHSTIDLSLEPRPQSPEGSGLHERSNTNPCADARSRRQREGHSS